MEILSELVIAKYLIETPLEPEKAAEIMAGEQSTGTFVTVPGETVELKENHSARVLKVEKLETVSVPSLPYAIDPLDNEFPKYNRAHVTLAFPVQNFGISLPNLLTAIAGNLYELKEFSGLRLIDIDLPASFAEKYKGPKFGIEGTRELAGVYGRPLIGTIVKPSIGLKIDEYKPIIKQLAEANLDFIKDDELCASPSFAPFEKRVNAIMDEIERAADKTGKKTMYAFNITGDIEEMKKNHDIVVNAGGTCVMVSINSIGMSSVEYINKYTELPIHGHRNQWGAMTRSPLLGMSFSVYQKLCRLAGVDHLHTNGLNSKFAESNESVIRSIQDCLTPMFNGYEVMPVLSSAQWAGSAITTYEAVPSIDVLHLAGGGILAHPDGIAAGVRSMQLGWKAAVEGQSLRGYAKKYTEIKKAMDKFGGKSN
ncbi:ribulose-bisphosphate carboxylase large subunit family protein [Planococcus sp. X10-3]|uniref:ribulose-bisphosphate carboxylase large subunit family protein n=1 Tax=Planococcus sp. X10-3 TaxID=3061240 RepID=UPI003BAFC7B2